MCELYERKFVCVCVCVCVCVYEVRFKINRISTEIGFSQK